MPAKRRSEEDDIQVYEPSDSDDDYDETEKELLKKVRNRKKEYSDSEDEVFNVGVSDEDDDDDDKSDLAASDIEGQGSDDGLPDARAWGKEKRKYYSTDYVDPDYGGFEGKDAHLAELEEEEARNIQKQLAQQLDDDDFSLEIFSEKPKEDKVEVEEVIKADISKLSKRQKLQILQKESPEFFGLVEDFKTKMLVVRDYLSPVLAKYKAKQIPDCKAVDFVQTQHQLIMNYCVNIYMYLLLKASKTNVQNHPVIKRLYQYRQLLLQLEPVFEEIIKPQIEIMLKEMQAEDEDTERVTEKKKTLKLLASLTQNEEGTKKKRVAFDDETRPNKKLKPADDDTEKNMEVEENQPSSSEDEDGKDIAEQNEEGVMKRAITYKMSKNKGLTPHRKKEQRNPRVKHKLKYKKALIRRKGAVREPRNELSRYSGEISGIKATVSKGIKIKT